MTAIAFDHTATGYGLPHVRCLAHAARLAYKDETEVEETARGWGFDRVRSFRMPLSRPFVLEDTQAYVMAGNDMIVIAFRGTEPEQVRDWLSDVNAPQVREHSCEGRVHWGFQRALDAVYSELTGTLREFRDSDQTVWVTGHSLGGALAMLAAARLHFADGVLADGVYTFGQPRTCDPALARVYEQAFQGRMYRFVNNNDIVAQVPPEPLYRHVSEVRHIDAGGRIREKPMSVLGGLTDSVEGHTADVLSPGADALRDHAMDAYITHLDAAVR
ncbi:Mbeg1-like protein [Nocardiopsis alba]|uniref:lipase family protein n=1 Tax=Nocardiopsis alba TaxID=53437 RepID=UPI0033EC0A56